jgi:hypothetical protein
MSNPLIRAVMRTKLLMTGRASATNSISKVRDQYLELASNLSLQEGTTAVSIPPMI